MTLKSAVVGGGEVSSVHLSCLSRHPEVDLRAVCDADEARAGERAATFDVRAYGDFEGMLALESLDWIHLCTPTDRHFEQARMAMADDLALQIECPLTERAETASELERLVADRNVRASVVHDGVFEPALRRARALVQEGAVGPPRAVDLLYTGEPWPHEIGDREWLAGLSGGAFEAALPRPVSQVLWLGGYPASSSAIAAAGTRRGASDDHFDFDGATFQYATADGICCSATVVASDVPRRLVRVHGDRGSVVADLHAGTVRVDDRSGDSLADTVRDTADRILDRVRRTDDLVGSSFGSADGGEATARNPHEALIMAEVAALRRGEPLPVPIEAGVWTVRVIEAIRSADTDDAPALRVEPAMDAV